MLDLQTIDTTVQTWMAEMRHLVLAELDKPREISHKKGPKDLVTNVDRLVERFYVEKIHALMPDAKIKSEEGFGDDVQDMSGDVWFVDPIDGTTNFVAQKQEFASMLAWYRDGEPMMAWIMDVMANELIHGGPHSGVYLNERLLTNVPNIPLEHGLIVVSGSRLLRGEMHLPEIARASLGYRVYGSAGMTFIHMCLGRSVGYLTNMQPWDFAAGIMLAEALGFKVGTVDGDAINMLLSGTVLVATPLAFDQIVSIND
ncbi:inositol monophosphatase family protein [Weissella ceti]|uniref:Inositol monophosphatase family protein n=1 Tax=Weissella ceti TaxID=759620 RepID=A0ABT3E3E8_9LACO|nr:inositol monophosphatase family protein [Weissella ceti]MCW0952870.1 inositol monophosphatase family protein [Weissella ceti]QVK12565.1 inositol monophosphatase family protein [Weissella ceti]